MSKIKLLIDSGCDATKEQLKAIETELVPLVITMGEEHVDDYYGIDQKEYFHHLRTCEVIPTTAQPSPATFIEYFERYMAEYDDILVITMSIGGSGTYHSAVLAREMFLEAHPECKCGIHIHDSWSCSLVEYMQAKTAKGMIDAGHSIEEILAYLDGLKRRTATFYLVEDIKFLMKGGRVSNLKGSVINTFNIKPIIAIVDGWGSNHSIAMGFKNGVSKLVSAFAKEAPEDGICYVSHCDSPQNAQLFVDMLKQKCPKATCVVTPMWATMATHSGPGGIGVFYERKA